MFQPSAASTYQAVVGFIIVFTLNMIVRKLDKECIILEGEQQWKIQV